MLQSVIIVLQLSFATTYDFIFQNFSCSKLIFDLSTNSILHLCCYCDMKFRRSNTPNNFINEISWDVIPHWSHYPDFVRWNYSVWLRFTIPSSNKLRLTRLDSMSIGAVSELCCSPISQVIMAKWSGFYVSVAAIEIILFNWCANFSDWNLHSFCSF